MLPSILTVFVFILGLFGYRQDGIFFDKGLMISDNKSNKLETKKYQKTGLSIEEREHLDQRLTQIMQHKKPYLESEITINDLAGQLDTSVHKLSQVINEKHNRNFFDFINNYRINDVKQLLSNSELVDSKIESIAYDCGFNSKSSFYAIFKKHTSLTPTKYRENIRQVSYQ